MSADLQWGTMRFIDSSHPCAWLRTAEGVLRFDFDPIYLPDSTADEANSHGFVRFGILPGTLLQLGDEVYNTANIYFDFNDPVITAPAVVTIDESTGIGDPGRQQLRAVPNPANDAAALVLDAPLASAAILEVRDGLGRPVLQGIWPSGAASVRIGTAALAPGLYQCRITLGSMRTLEVKLAVAR